MDFVFKVKMSKGSQMLVLHAGIDLGGFTWARTKKGVILEKLLNVDMSTTFIFKDTFDKKIVHKVVYTFQEIFPEMQWNFRYSERL